MYYLHWKPNVIFTHVLLVLKYLMLHDLDWQVGRIGRSALAQLCRFNVVESAATTTSIIIFVDSFNDYISFLKVKK